MKWKKIFFDREDKSIRVIFIFLKICLKYLQVLHQIYVLWIYSPASGFSFHFLTGIFWRVKLFKLCLFMVKVLCILRKFCQTIELKNNFLYFRSLNFIDSMILLGINFVVIWRKDWLRFIFPHGYPTVPKQKINVSWFNHLICFVKKTVKHICVCLFLSSLLCQFWCIIISL